MNSSRAKKMKLFSASVVTMFCSSMFFANCSQHGFQLADDAGELSLGSSGDPSAVAISFQSAPADLVTSDSVSFNYSLSGQNISNVSLKCYLNGAVQPNCSSPLSLSGLADNDYTFTVEAMNQNSLVLATAKRSFRVDRQAPVLTVQQAPPATLGATAFDVSFSVTDNYPGAVSYCSLDNAAAALCDSPYHLVSLAIGAHSVKIYAQDKAGNKSTTQTLSFTVNLAVPTVAISQTPAAVTNSTSASFSFSGSSSNSTITSYECAIDNGAYAACTSPRSYTGLGEASHTFSVRAKDAIGQTSSPASYSFAVDLTKPSMPVVASNLLDPSKMTSLNLTFNSSDSSGINKFECKLDAGAYAACVSPQTYNNLSIANHTFLVRATDKAGNVSAEGSYSITIDNAAPVVTITSQPASSTQSTSASFSFTVSDVLSGVNLMECQLDNQMFASCTSPKNYTSLAVGTHNFVVRGSDKAGNSATQSYSWTIAAAATPTPTPTATPPISGVGVADADPAGIFDGNGGFNAAAYKAMAAAYGTPAMIPFRFGKDSTYYNPGGVSAPTLYERPQKYYCDPENTQACYYYTMGTPAKDVGDFASNAGQIGYVTDTNVAISKVGVDDIQTFNQDHLLVAPGPQPDWTRYGGGRPAINFDPNFLTTTQKNAMNAAGGVPTKLVELTRAMGNTAYSAEALIVFQTGQISVSGYNTANIPFYYKPFPSNLVPTAAAVTNAGEFALITLWDTQNLTAKLAVIALGGTQPTDTFWNYEWNELYPGFQNYSMWTFMKLLGYIDLPGIVAPTAVEAVGDRLIGQGLNQLPGQVDPGSFTLTNKTNWSCFNTGKCNSVNEHGFALVSSRYEKKVLVVDLTPLFQKIRKGMFDDWNTFRANVANTGMGDTQWPPVFSQAPDFAPKVAATLSFDKQVTAISASIYGDNRGVIATEDGVVHVYDVDGLQTGGAGANPKQVSTFQAGRNITRLAHMRHWPWTGTGAAGQSTDVVRYQYIAVSRGDKRIDWLDVNSKSIVRTLRDSRMVDPITAEDNGNAGTEVSLLNVGDYGGKSVRGYLYDKVILHTNGELIYKLGPTGTDQFEYGGGYETPTGVFSISSNNIT